jgi:hypothetical protein
MLRTAETASGIHVATARTAEQSPTLTADLAAVMATSLSARPESGLAVEQLPGDV